MLILKLLIVPFFVGAITLAARRWGPQLAGLLAGFPVVTGPILFFITLEQGRPFAAQSAASSVSAVAACTAFCLAYAATSRRSPWPLALLAGLSGWGLVAYVSATLAPSLTLAIAITFVALLAGLRLLPSDASSTRPKPTPPGELVARMVAGAVLVALVTAVAGSVGPRWSGLLAMFPVLASVLSVFSHRANGAAFVTRLFRGMLLGFFSFTGFCVSLSLLLPHWGTATAFASAIMMALLVQAAVQGAVRLSTRVRFVPSAPDRVRG